VDTVAPQTSIVSGPKLRTTARTAKLTFRSPQAGVTFQCKLDKSAWRGCRSPLTYRKVKRGAHIFQVRAKDAAGNVDATPAKRAWRVH